MVEAAPDTQLIPLDLIKEGPDGLRSFDTENVDFQGIVESIRQKGFLSAVTVRPKKDEEDNVYYEILDGLQRTQAARMAGLKEVRCIVVNSFSDNDKTLWQIMANAHAVPTKPIEYTRALKRVIDTNPTMTKQELAAKLGKSPAFIEGRLGLLKLTEPAQRLVDEGQITLNNAFALTKLPEDEQSDFLDQAVSLPTSEFSVAVNDRCKEITEAKRAGRKVGPKEFSPLAKVRTLSVIEAEVEASGRSVISQLDENSTVDEAVMLTLNWAIGLDPETVQVQRVKYEAMQAEREQARKQRERAKAEEKIRKAEEIINESK